MPVGVNIRIGLMRGRLVSCSPKSPEAIGRTPHEREKIMRYRKHKLILILVMICGISYLHYAAKLHQPLLHLIHRELYLVPIILSAYWFGKKIGLSVSIIASILYLPWTLMTTPGATAYHVINVLHVVMFNVIAYIVGIYHEARISQFGLGKSKTAISERTLPGRGRNVLLCIDSSPNALKSA
jgi:hypothetical protein